MLRNSSARHRPKEFHESLPFPCAATQKLVLCNRAPRVASERNWATADLRKLSLPKAAFRVPPAALPVTVISLAASSDRRRRFEKSARAQNLTREYVEAVSGIATDPQEGAPFEDEVHAKLSSSSKIRNLLVALCDHIALDSNDAQISVPFLYCFQFIYAIRAEEAFFWQLQGAVSGTAQGTGREKRPPGTRQQGRLRHLPFQAYAPPLGIPAGACR